ncbi:DEAD/DEAH box helicase [Gordonia McavH-238-E]|uniref:DEAD/DEAH box helicase n=1 Tax=Gordonia sp. McavH-238-E TaxID=2917736 RepID=UPI001EF5F52C|nr:DEAD/DEAH box helicase family protein [Gordonia sp. McavH-238-E]MCG7630895.1 DEAD/DEAH box helicase [Gordonia sp. McavH-238-E]
MQTLCDSIRGEMSRIGPLTSVELADRLSVSVTEVQGALLGHDAVFAPPIDGAEAWALVSAEQLAERLGMSRPLRPWQIEALQKWIGSGRVGVVEAVTGAGKTDVGIAAIADARRRGVPTLILVPDRELVDHWRRILEKSLPGIKVGTPDGSKALAVPEQLIVCTPTGLGKRRLTAFRGAGLLIVDELQRIPVADYTDVVFPRTEITERLGLTAAYEWSNSHTERIVRPYLGDLIKGCDYQRAVEEGILARPLILTVGVSFLQHEREAYEACSQRLSAAERKLRDTGVDLSAGLYDTARQIDSGALVGEISFLAREYLDALAARRRVLDECASKVSAVGSLVRGLGDATRTIVFTPSDTASLGVVDAVLPSGVSAAPIASNHDVSSVLGRFTSGAVSLLATNRLMDEGVSVPTAQVGVVLASARSRAQMLQRMGRVIHPTDWVGRTAFVLVYVNATVEDPDLGGLEGHATDLMAIAAKHLDVGAGDAVRHLTSWLAVDSPTQEPREEPAQVDTDVVVSDEWDPEDAILDIVDEYHGLLTWDELREVLPDLEVEQTLMNGVDAINWMRIGRCLLGMGGRRFTEADKRIAALGHLANLLEARETQPVAVSDIAATVEAVAREFRFIPHQRLQDVWENLGGEVTGPEVDRSSAVPEPAGRDGSDDAHGESLGVDTEAIPRATETGRAGPAIQSVIHELEAHGATAQLPTGRPSGVLHVVGPDGVQRTVRVHSGIAGSWRVSQADAKLTTGDGVDAIVFTDRGATPPAFYIAPVTPYVKRVRAVIDAWVKSHPRDNRSGHVNIEKWVVQDGLDRWDLLWPKQKPSPRTSQGKPGAERLDIEFQREPEPITRPSDIQYSPEGEVRVILVHENARVVGFFDPRTSRLRIAAAPGAAKLAGREFRNPAIAAGTVMSALSGRTMFGVGFDNWIVDENTQETLAGYVDDELRMSVSAGT